MHGIGILLLRAGSKGLQHKNRIELAGKPLFVHSLDFLLSDPRVSEVVVSTDDPEIMSYCRDLENVCVRVRPEILSNDTASSEDALVDAITWYETTEPECDFVVYCQATEPLRPAGILTECIDKYSTNDFDCVFAACEYHKNFWQMQDGNLVRITDERVKALPRQTKPAVLREDTGICLVASPALIRNGRRIGDRPGCVIYDHPGRLIDIHALQDLEITEALIKAGLG